MNLSRESKGKGYIDEETGRGEVKNKKQKKKFFSADFVTLSQSKPIDTYE